MSYTYCCPSAVTSPHHYTAIHDVWMNIKHITVFYISEEAVFLFTGVLKVVGDHEVHL